MNKIIIVFLFFCTTIMVAQTDTLKLKVDTVSIQLDSIVTPLDIANFEPFNNVIINQTALNNVFEKLYLLEQNKDRKVRIVHLGDSHIQADIFTAKLRGRMHQVFGNAGFGFTFPYSLANTNNSAPIKFTGAGGFITARNSQSDSNKPIGISGILFKPKSKNFHIEIQTKDPQYNFNKIKIISPNSANDFAVSFDKKTTSRQFDSPIKIRKKLKKHKIKSGENLGSIADKYNISISELKKENKLKSDQIRNGKTLKIPGGEDEIIYKTKTEVKYSYVPVLLEKSDVGNFYASEKPLDKITLIENNTTEEVALNGLILENNNPGVTYSGIGVNGAKFSDFNKFSLFETQLPQLEADLFILSFGTNESYDFQDQEKYYAQLKQMVISINKMAPEASILITTPPPSVLRKNHNGYIEIYSEVIQGKAIDDKYAVWNLLDVFGGNKNIQLNARMGLMAKDKVHYSNSGYDKQGELFFDAFIQSYEFYKSTK